MDGVESLIGDLAIPRGARRLLACVAGGHDRETTDKTARAAGISAATYFRAVRLLVGLGLLVRNAPGGMEIDRHALESRARAGREHREAVMRRQRDRARAYGRARLLRAAQKKGLATWYGCDNRHAWFELCGRPVYASRYLFDLAAMAKREFMRLVRGRAAQQNCAGAVPPIPMSKRRACASYHGS